MTRPRASEALSGIRVLDLTTRPGAYCTKLLADLGADVLKVEPPAGDPTRRLPPFRGNVPDPEASLTFLYYNSNKRSITLDLQIEEGRALFRRLVPTADVVVEDSKPGTLDGMGLGFEQLRELQPSLVMTSITPFGQTGPYSRYEATDIGIVAMGGLLYISGEPEGRPITAPGCQGYDTGSIHAAVATLAALRTAVQEGGVQLDISLHECLVAEEYGISRFAAEGIIRRRQGSQHEAGVPGTLYPAADGWVHIYVSPGHPANWPHFLEFVGNPPDLAREEWKDFKARLRDVAEINRLIGNWTCRRTRAALQERAREFHEACAPMLTPGEFTEHPAVLARGYFVEADHPRIGPHRFPGPPCRLTKTPWALRSPAPLLGEHNVEVYQGQLGLGSRELEAHRRMNVL